MREEWESQRWISYELHDGLLQWIVGARMQLEATIGKYPDSPQQAELERILRYVERAIEEGRSLIGFIESGAPARSLDFRELIQRFIDTARPLAAEKGQTIALQMEPSVWPELPTAIVWNLFRIAEQAVRNAIKHAGPGEISLRTERLENDMLRLVVEDSGVGITAADTQPQRGGHFGLNSMRHRASILGGSLTIQPAENRGTVVSLVFPVATLSSNS
jgi:signal transduction histidine kinase